MSKTCADLWTHVGLKACNKAIKQYDSFFPSQPPEKIVYLCCWSVKVWFNAVHIHLLNNVLHETQRFLKPANTKVFTPWIFLPRFKCHKLLCYPVYWEIYTFSLEKCVVMLRRRVKTDKPLCQFG